MSLIEKISGLEQRTKALEETIKGFETLFDEQLMIQKYLFGELEQKVSLSRSMSDLRWLYKNRSERMDASLTNMFEITRAEFHSDRYRFASDFVKGKVVADIACGTGYGTKLLHEAGSRSVIGIDVSLESIRYAKRYFQDDTMEFISCSAYETPLDDNALDVLVSFETLEHLDDEGRLLEEFNRVLRPDGLLIISTPNDWGIDELSPFHVKSYDYDKLVSTLNEYFLIENIYNQNSGTPSRKENKGQPRGIVETTSENHITAECFIAVCKNRVGDA